MNDMQAGDILLFKSEEGLGAKLIAWGTESPYTHVAVCVSPAMNLAIEAMPGGGVRARDIRQINTAYDIFRIKEEFSYDLANTISFLVAALNKKFDRWGVTYLGLLKALALLRIPVKDVANKWQKDRDYFCSELCYEAFFYGGGLDIVPDVEEADITSPADIAGSSVVIKITPAEEPLEEKKENE